MHAQHYNTWQRDRYVSSRGLLFRCISTGYRCNRMIERNLKDAGTIVDTKFAYDATSRKISVHVGADNVITLNSDLASIMGFSPRQLIFREERRGRSL